MLPATVYPIPSGAETTAIILFLLITVALPVYVLVFRPVRAGESWGPAEMVATTVLFVAALLLVGPVVGAAEPLSLLSLSLLTLIQNALFVGLPAFVALLRYRLPAASLGLGTRGWHRGVMVGAAVAAIATPLAIGGEHLAVYLLGLVEGPEQAAARVTMEHLADPLLPILGALQTPASIAWLIVLICVVVPIGEEIFFRGFVFGGLRARWGVPAAAAASAVFFAAVHLQLVHGLPIFLLGVLLALAYQRTGSLVPAIVAHALNNVVALLSAWRGWGI
jgi:membrane protease YdiL (CAAX protease family)